MGNSKDLSPQLLLAIDEAVKRAVSAVRVAQIDDTRNLYRQTERRLYAFHHLREKVMMDSCRLADMKEGYQQNKSKSIVRFSASGIRTDPEEMYEAIERDLAARIASDQQEIDEVMSAVKGVEGDSYYRTVPARYFEGSRDWEVAAELHCDDSTVRRNRARLVRIIAIRLYGVAAIG
ncbi:MAG: hypothetical protein RR367_11520 [Clostridia bacterium]